ncbi:MAG: type IIL restriction-modification enzyme MmeI [Verrucomicrobiota bacterium]
MKQICRELSGKNTRWSLNRGWRLRRLRPGGHRLACQWSALPLHPRRETKRGSGQCCDLVRPVVNSEDLTTERGQRWIIDTGDLALEAASRYEAPFKIVVERVKPHRDSNRDKWLRENWWRPQRMRHEMRKTTHALERFIVTPTTSKHRVFAWLTQPILPDHKLVVIARCDDPFSGILHSRLHELWSKAAGTQLRERESGLNYSVQSSFESFPFPRPPPAQEAAIAAAAKELDIPSYLHISFSGE